MADENPPTAPPADAAAEWRPRSSPVLIAISVMLGTFMEVLDTSVANVALPHIAGSLSATPEQATWVLTSYLISNAIVLPVTAWLSAAFGRKRFLLTCIIIFTLASAACGAAYSLEAVLRIGDKPCDGFRGVTDLMKEKWHGKSPFEGKSSGDGRTMLLKT